MDKWAKTASDCKAVQDGCTFDLARAEKVRNFISRFCKHSIGEWHGKQFDLLDWQFNDIIAPLYSWRKPDGSNRFRTASIWIPKNNGKSALCSAISLFELVGRDEAGALVVNLASTIEQANIVFKGAAAMVEQSPALDELCWIRKNIKTIEYDRRNATLKVMSGDRGGGKHGFAISCLIIDELAEQTDRELYDTMAANARKRKNAILISISTAGFRRESIAYEQFCYAQKVLHGDIIDTEFLPVVYAADPAHDWTSLDTFAKCNPSINVTIDPSEVQGAIQEAKNEPRKEYAYKTLRLNLWTGAATAWVAQDKWAACGEDFQETMFHHDPVWLGWDYGFKGDLASYCIVANHDKLTYIMPRFFCPKSQAERKQKTDHVPYLHWAEKGFIHLTDGDVIDPAYIRQCLADDALKFNFQEVGFDPTGLEESRQICEAEYGWSMVSIPQRSKGMHQAATWFERAVLSKTLRHPNHPVLDWCLQNCATKETPDGLQVYRGSGETQRNDGIIAALMAISRYTTREDSPQFFVTN